jgi:hypothetical protein
MRYDGYVWKHSCLAWYVCVWLCILVGFVFLLAYDQHCSLDSQMLRGGAAQRAQPVQSAGCSDAAFLHVC